MAVYGTERTLAARAVHQVGVVGLPVRKRLNTEHNHRVKVIRNSVHSIEVSSCIDIEGFVYILLW